MPRKNLDINNGTFNLTRTEMSTLARWHLTCAQTLVNVFTFNEEQLKEYQHHIAQSVKFAEAVARRVDKMQRLEEKVRYGAKPNAAPVEAKPPTGGSGVPVAPG